MSAWIWIAGGILLLLAEAFVPGLVIGFLGIAAIIVGSLVYFNLIPDFLSQSAVWLIISAILIIVLREQAARIFPSREKRNYSKDSDDVTGKTGLVAETIRPETGGRVRIYGTTWHARQDEETIKQNIVLSENTPVYITKRDNLILYVRPLPEKEAHCAKQTTDPYSLRPDSDLYSERKK